MYCRNPCCYSFGRGCGGVIGIFSVFFIGECEGLGAYFVAGDNLTGRCLGSGNLDGMRSININLDASFLRGVAGRRLPRLTPVGRVGYLGLLCINIVRPEHGSLFVLSVLGRLGVGNMGCGLVVVNQCGGRTCGGIFGTEIRRLKLFSCVCCVPEIRRGFLDGICTGASVFLLPAVCSVCNVMLLRSVCFEVPAVADVGKNSGVVVRSKAGKFVVPGFRTGI